MPVIDGVVVVIGKAGELVVEIYVMLGLLNEAGDMLEAAGLPAMLLEIDRVVSYAASW
jgi:hypothetical protein